MIIIVTFDEKQQYLIVHAILMALKQMVWEEELLKITGNERNSNSHSEKNNAIPHFFQLCEKQWMQFN